MLPRNLGTLLSLPNRIDPARQVAPYSTVTPIFPMETSLLAHLVPLCDPHILCHPGWPVFYEDLVFRSNL